MASSVQPSNLIRHHIESFLEEAENLNIFLPHWIEHRSNILEKLTKSGSAANGTIATVAGTIAKLGSTASGYFCGIDSRIGAAAGAINQAVTFGFTSGLNKGQAEVNNRRLNYLCDDLSEDKNNTNDFEDIIIRVMDCLSALLGDLQSCTDLPPGDNTLQEITSALKNPSSQTNDCRSPQYQAIVGWSDQISQLLQKFLTVLRQSNAPYAQISNLLERNPAPSVNMEIQEIVQWVSALRDGARAIESASSDAQLNAVTAHSLLARILPSAQNNTDGQIASRQPSNVQATRNSTPNSNHPSNGPGSADSTCEIDQWFREIRRLFERSIEIANEVERLFDEEHIPLKGNRG